MVIWHLLDHQTKFQLKFFKKTAYSKNIAEEIDKYSDLIAIEWEIKKKTKKPVLYYIIIKPQEKLLLV